MAVTRIGPREAREKNAQVVCAYEDEEKCRAAMLEGAITLNELNRRAESLPDDTPLVFYCQ